MGPRAFQTAGLADVGSFVKAGFKLHQRGDGLAVFGSFAKGFDNRGAFGRAIERLLDRHHIGVPRSLLQEAHDHVEGLIRVVQQHVFLADGGKHVAVKILYALRHTRCERRPKQVWAIIQDHFFEVCEANHSVDVDHFVAGYLKLFHNQLFKACRSVGGDFKAHNFATAASLQGNLKFAHEVLGLVFDLQIAVTQNAEGTVAFGFVTGEDAVQMQDQQLLKGQDAQGAIRGG
mmetsp:Transcript_9061/g.15098  ORF Transcript_9061/g.15098 Transcript_9061/m.15098 type:complete len:232 (+) Transcript_9061:120-815(+)